MRPKVSEIRKITDLLDREWENVEDLARTVLEAAFVMTSERDQWVVIMQDARLGAFVFGPYETENKARKAIGTDIVSAGPGAAAGFVRRIRRAT